MIGFANREVSMRQAQHIGIVGCSAEGAALCYRTICLEGSQLMGPHDHPEITVHTHSLREYVPYYQRGDWEGVARLMLSSAEKLAKAGADFLICPDNTIHQAFDLVAAKSPLPWLHIAEEVANEAVRNGYKRVGITGTKYLTESRVYPDRLEAAGIEYRIPPREQRERIEKIIMDELVMAEFTRESLAYFLKVINDFDAQGCHAVVLGCTEIPLLVTPDSSPLPTLDSTRILARAALRQALGIEHTPTAEAAKKVAG